MSKKKSEKKKKSPKKGSYPSQHFAKKAAVSANPKTLEKVLLDNPNDLIAALSLAEHYYNLNQETRIPAVLKSIAVKNIKPKTNDRLRYYVLLSIGYANSGELIEAERIIEMGLEEFPDAIDFQYMLSFVKLSLREYDKSIEAGNKFISLLSPQPKYPPYCGRTSHLSQLYNIIGSAFFEKKEFDSAIGQFKKAIKADHGNHLPYLNLAKLHYHRKENEAAIAAIKEGLTFCRQIDELKMLKQTVENYRTVSACMIVKDEEELLEGCLKSIRNWVDEIIIVDTGSTDKTIEIAESYGAKIFHQQWEGDFSKHRNYSLEQATSDWIFIIDADERLCEEDIPKLQGLINSDEHSIVSINVYSIYGDNEEMTTFLPSIRLFKREMELRYQGIVHNRLEFPEDATIVRAEVKLIHLGYDLSPKRMKAKFERSKALLEKQLEENPQNAFALYNLAQLYRGRSKDDPAKFSDEIIKFAQRAVKVTDPDDLHTRNIHLMSLDQLAWAYFYKKDFASALKYAEEALSHKKNYLDPLLLLGHIYTQTQEIDKAIDSYKIYLDKQAKYRPTLETDNIILINPDSRAAAFYGLALIYELTEKFETALEYYRKTADINSSHLDVQKRIEILKESLSAEPSKHQKELVEELSGLISGNQLESAVKLVETAVGRSDSPREIFASAAHLFSSNGNQEQAIRYYRKVIEIDSSDPAILNDLANCYFKTKQYEEAKGYYLQAANLKNTPDIVYRNLGLTLIGTGERSDSLKYFDKYLETNRQDKQIARMAANLHASDGQYSTAVSQYETVLASDPSDHESLYNMSECYLQMGHIDSARAGFERVLRLSPDFKQAQKRLFEITQVAVEV